MSKFGVGDIVYVNSCWSVADKCYIVSSLVDGAKQFYKVESHGMGGTFNTPEENVFNTHEDALKAYNNDFNKRVDNYKNEIKTIKDLVEFSLNYELNGEDPDYAARDAYIARCKDLLNVDYYGERGLR